MESHAAPRVFAYNVTAVYAGSSAMVQETKSSVVNVRLSPSLKKELDELARADDRPLSSCCERMFRAHVPGAKKASKRKQGLTRHTRDQPRMAVRLTTLHGHPAR